MFNFEDALTALTDVALTLIALVIAVPLSLAIALFLVELAGSK